VDRIKLAENFVRSIVKQLIFDGFFHADPHPGNVLVNIHTGTIIFLDMGMMGTLDRMQKLDLADLILSLYMGDLKDLGRVIVRLSTPFKPFDEDSFYRQLERQVGRYFVFVEGSNSLSNVMGTTLALMHEHGLRLNQELTLALKAMIQAEEAALTLDPNVEFINISIRESQELLSRRIDSAAIVDMAKKEGVRTVKEVVRRLPTLQSATMKWLDQYEKGRLTVELDTSDLSRQIGEFSVAIQSLAIGFILAGVVVGTAMGVAFAGQAAGRGYWLLMALFLCSLLVSIIIGWRLIRKMTK
jgi:ubiquinone biosynthesis protein